MTTTAVPTWSLKGDWFDVCTCNVVCPCTFAQAPTGNHCEAVLAYRINEGTFGDTDMSGLNVLGSSASPATCGRARPRRRSA